MSSMDFYNSLRKSGEEGIRNKHRGKYRAILGYGKCSIFVGANEVLKSLQEVLATGKIDNVIIETTGCIGLCSKEPLLDIYTPDGKRFTYEFVTADKARAIIVSHAILNEEMDEWLIKM
ncbi:(2Fe-2S) ferredoxin domain-containing protein [Alkaliphilus peptidifermentans]|uniref:NADP-reducing hydrogenase subunit HndB n=1 Tax=Alkaliphilus peptidifermentans DSM 18978 TaxID=1120976 RepID=A0A1G5L0J9_9FIRM|nr:(2Fe-2S) ferredoxin domain-containing protein [Alkaliphilus peptidifermentans]SCZ06405.1 NADP-reducing hydrogenase subunit HndB [Alkaliphilus peptidifermentans DSM 18978]